nr:hypothetical protein [Paramagnetospirillum magneticum]
MADSTPISAGANTLRSLSEWERITRELLEEGQNFLAHDTARDGLRQYPDSFKLAIFGAVALSQTGAVDEARRLLQPVLDVILIDEGPFHRLHNSLRRAVEGLDEADSQDTWPPWPNWPRRWNWCAARSWWPAPMPRPTPPWPGCSARPGWPRGCGAISNIAASCSCAPSTSATRPATASTRR